MDKPDMDKPDMDKPDMDMPPAIDRTRRLIAEMRQVIEDARRSVLAARDLLKRLPNPEGADPVPSRVGTADQGSPGEASPGDLTLRLVDILLEAHTLANLDDDADTRVLLETALLRVGQRLAREAGPRAAGLVLQ